MLRVGMDISQTAHSGGVATYTRELAKELSQMKDLEMFFFFSSLRQKAPTGLKNLKSYKLPPTLFEMVFNKWRNVGIEKFIGPVDIFHSSDWTQPKSNSKKVTTYHDLVPLKFPQWSHPKIIAVHKRKLKLVEKEIDMVICVSKATQKDLLEISKIPEEKTVVIYEGVSDKFKPQSKSDILEFRKKMGLPEEFVLSIGGVGERRNLKRIREACKKYELVITGETIPWVSFEDLPLLYASAKILLYPSFYEGFGLPIIEAMACGTPVITSNVSSMPEAGGEACEYVNPESVIDIENKLKLVWDNDKKRETMIQKGFIQAQKFSWQKCAEETVEVYRKLSAF